MMTALTLFWEFFKTGLFSVGGGLATLPFLYVMSRKTGWFTASDLANMIAVSESTPGPIGVNMATYVGVTTLGFFGGLISTAGLVMPALIIITVVSRVMEKFKDSFVVKGLFYGLRPASAALIASAGFGVLRISLLDISLFRSTGAFSNLIVWRAWLLAAAVLIIYKKFKPHPIFVIAIAAVVGVVFKM